MEKYIPYQYGTKCSQYICNTRCYYIYRTLLSASNNRGFLLCHLYASRYLLLNLVSMAGPVSCLRETCQLLKRQLNKENQNPSINIFDLQVLTGGVGLFQKIGLTGLPLTTLALVAFFASGVMWFDDKSENSRLLDFTKLTLGAFIGSFVQRQVERRGQESDIQRAIQTVAQTQQNPPSPSTLANGSTRPPSAPVAQ